MSADLTPLTEEQLLALLRSPRLADAVRPPSPWLTPQEAAAYLNISLGTLRNWTSARYVPFSKRGRVVRYHKDIIDKWLAKGACAGRANIADHPK
jgi:excisionase family DNA binding protein